MDNENLWALIEELLEKHVNVFIEKRLFSFFLSLWMISNEVIFSQQFYFWVWTSEPEDVAEHLKRSRIFFSSSLSDQPCGALLPSHRCAVCISADPWRHRRNFIICGFQISAGHDSISHFPHLSWIVPLPLTPVTYFRCSHTHRNKSFHLLITSTLPSSNWLWRG